MRKLFLSRVLELDGTTKIIHVDASGQNRLLLGSACVAARQTRVFLAQVLILNLLPTIDHLGYLLRANAFFVEFRCHRSEHWLFNPSRRIFDPSNHDIFAGRPLTQSGQILFSFSY